MHDSLVTLQYAKTIDILATAVSVRVVVPDDREWDLHAISLLNATTQSTLSVYILPRIRLTEPAVAGWTNPGARILIHRETKAAGLPSVYSPQSAPLHLGPGDAIDLEFSSGGLTDVATALLLIRPHYLSKL